MITVKLTAGDTKPLSGNYTSDLTDHSLSLVIGYPTPATIAGTITDAAAGEFQFEFGEGDLQPGTFVANVIITYPGGETETTDRFIMQIDPGV